MYFIDFDFNFGLDHDFHVEQNICNQIDNDHDFDIYIYLDLDLELNLGLYLDLDLDLAMDDT